MNCFTLYWNKLGILTWSVSWAADNEQLRDRNNLNQYSCLKGMGMTVFQNLPYSFETDKYANRYAPPTPRFPNYHCVVFCSHMGTRRDLKAENGVSPYCTHFTADLTPLVLVAAPIQLPFYLNSLQQIPLDKHCKCIFVYKQLWGWFYCCP